MSRRAPRITVIRKLRRLFRLHDESENTLVELIRADQDYGVVWHAACRVHIDLEYQTLYARARATDAEFARASAA